MKALHRNLLLLCMAIFGLCVWIFHLWPKHSSSVRPYHENILHNSHFAQSNIDLPGRTFHLVSTASFSYPYVKHPKVAHYINHFREKNRVNFIRESLERAEPYIPYILSKLEYYNLPYELLYLPIIESGYRLEAVSRAKAVGAWQFMAGSALPYGLTINHWRDDRRDILLSTDAALRKIRDEIYKTGDLWLALAAYNGGLTRILRARRILRERGLNTDFWTMIQEELLPRETTNYVPKFIAINHLIRTKIRFNISKLRKNAANKRVAFFENPGHVHLRHLAKAIGIDLHDIRILNSGLLKDMTPPYNLRPQYFIRVPTQVSDKAQQFLAAYKRPLPPISRSPVTITKAITHKTTKATVNKIPINVYSQSSYHPTPKHSNLPKTYLGQSPTIPRIPEFLK